MREATMKHMKKTPVPASGPRRPGARVFARALPLCLLLLPFVVPQAAGVVNAAPPPPGGMVCADPTTTGPGSATFDLRAVSGLISIPDGGSIRMWSYAPVVSGTPKFQVPGPVLCANEGDTVTVNLTNDLNRPDLVSVIFPGQDAVGASGGVPGLLTNEVADGGGTVSYTFTAAEPGTYIYESGSEPSKQVQMGLYGALVVRPSGAPAGECWAYDHPDSRYDCDREYLILLHDIDPALHRAVARNKPYDVTTMHDDYWTINGRAFPDTIAPNGVTILPNQPYGSMVTIEPYDATVNPHPALVRYVNAGMVHHPFHPHGNNFRLIARDGRFLARTAASASYETFTTTLGAGQTADALVSWHNLDDYSSALNPLSAQGPGIKIPNLRNVVFKDGLTWYSGSPYLGETDDLPVGVTSYSECGEFYFPLHSHALNEFQNSDEGFGGMATLLRVDPAGGCP
jgi:hypothetical protein